METKHVIIRSRKTFYIGLIFAFILIIPMIYYTYKVSFEEKKGKYDTYYFENPKTLILAKNAKLELLKNFQNKMAYPQTDNIGTKIIDSLFKNISVIEIYKLYGTESWQRKNYEYVKVLFIDNSEKDIRISEPFSFKYGGKPDIEKIYLAKVFFKNGDIIKVLSNGNDLNFYPNDIQNKFKICFQKIIFKIDEEKNFLNKDKSINFPQDEWNKLNSK